MARQELSAGSEHGTSYVQEVERLAKLEAGEMTRREFLEADPAIKNVELEMLRLFREAVSAILATSLEDRVKLASLAILLKDVE